MALCQACGAETRWVEVDGERVALDKHPSIGGKYVLDTDDLAIAHRVEVPDKVGFAAHDETCPAKVRERERRARTI